MTLNYLTRRPSKYLRRSHLFWLLTAFLSSTSHALECPRVPEQARNDLEIVVRSAVGKIGAVKESELESRTRSVTRDLLGKLPKADKVYLELMMYAAYCSTLRDDANLTEAQKGARIRAYNLELKKVLEEVEGGGKYRADPRDVARAELDRIPLPYTPSALVESAKEGNLEAVKLFLAAGMNPNSKREEGEERNTALMYAARYGHLEIAKVLLKAKANVNERNNRSENQSGATALEWAVATRFVPDNSDLIRLLLDNGSDADSINEAFQDATRRGDVNILRMLRARGVAKESLNIALVIASGAAKWRPLDEATQKEVVHFLLQQGADVNATDRRECTALQAASIPGSVEIVRILLDAGADPSAKPPCTWHAHRQGWPPLMLALSHAPALKGKAAATLLMSRGANPDLTSDEGVTTLMVAAADKNNIEIVRAVLDKGVDPNQVNNAGETALLVASGLAGNTPMVELLLNRGADPNLVAENGMTALINASWVGDTATIRLLLERGANPNAKATSRREWGKDKFTALMWAAAYPLGDGEELKVEALLDAGVDLHARSEKGRTALMIAVGAGNIGRVKALLRRGAKVNDEDARAKTALNYAEEYEYQDKREDLIRVLKKAGAK